MSLRIPLRKFAISTSGNFAMAIAAAFPVLIGLLGGAIDLIVYHNHQTELQDAADAAVLAAAREASVKGWSQTTASSLVDIYLEHNLRTQYARGVKFEHNVKVDETSRSVKVILTQDHYGYFYLGYFTGSPQITVMSMASLSGHNNVCLLVKDPAGKEMFKLDGDAAIRAKGCSAYSNSVHAEGIHAKGSTKLATQVTCSVGGFTGNARNYAPIPLTDCPSFADPLASRSAAMNSEFGSLGCKTKDVKIKGGIKTLSPGVYCGGLEIDDGARVRLEAGVYVIKNGKLKIDGGSAIEGIGISFVFIGKDASLDFRNDSTISISAPERGSTAGLLMYAQPTGKKRTFKIASRNAHKLLGTVYLPEEHLIVGGDADNDGKCDPEIGGGGGESDDDDDDEEDGEGAGGGGLGVDCTSDVGTSSAWTVIIARQLTVTNGVQLVLNADYSGSDVPVPGGLGPTSSVIRLLQ